MMEEAREEQATDIIIRKITDQLNDSDVILFEEVT